MKKVLVVLLIAVLAIGAVFADASLTGNLKSTVKYDLDSETSSLSQSASFTAGFAFDLFNGTGASKGENYPYAEIEANLSLGLEDFSFDTTSKGYMRIKANNLFWNNSGDVLSESTTWQTAGYLGYGADSLTHPVSSNSGSYTINNGFDIYDARTIKFNWTSGSVDDVLTKAVIVGENWSLDLLNNAGVGNFATNAVGDTQTFALSNKVASKVAFDLNNATEEDDGITLTYDGHTFAVNRFFLDETYYGDEDYTKDAFELGYQSKDLILAEGVTAKAAASYQVNGDVYYGNGSAKVAYEAEDVAVAVAGDVAVNFVKDDTTAEYDVAVDAAYLEDAVKFDFYFASEATAETPYSNMIKVNKALYNIAYKYVYDNSKHKNADDPSNIIAKYFVSFKNAGDEVSSSYASAMSDATIVNLMSAKLAVDVAKFAELGEVSALSLTVEGHDMLNEEKSASVNKHAFNAEVSAAAENFGVSGKFGAKKFTVADSRKFYAEVATDFAKFTELPVDSLVLTVGSTDLDMDYNYPSSSASKNNDCLYVDVTSAINETLTVGLTGNYLVGKERTDLIGVNATFTGVEGLSLTAAVDHAFAADVDNDTTLELSGSYTCDLVTVTALVQGSFADDDEASSKFGAYVGAESTTLVDGATIGLYYSELDDSGDVTTNYTDPGNAGYVAAVCKISF